MFGQLFLLLTLVAHSPAEAQETFPIYRVDAIHQVAVIQSYEAEKIKIGDLYKIETAEGVCHTPVSEVLDGFFYVNTEQCRAQDVQKGVSIISAHQIPMRETPRAPAQETAPSFHFSEASGTTATTTNAFMESAFFKNHIANKLSLYLGYHAGTDLEGSIPLDSQVRLSEVTGANTLGFGAEYLAAEMPYNLSAVGGVSYNLPRSYGRYSVQGSNSTVAFDENPQLQLWSFYLNVRYRFLREGFFFMGINHLVASMSTLPGDTSGDWGFHTGARYYPLKHFFVEGALNLYNLDYEFQGTKTDISLTELEIKGGYTF